MSLSLYIYIYIYIHIYIYIYISIKEKNVQTDWRHLRTGTRCELDTKVCTKGRRNSFSCMTIPSPHSHIHSDTHTHTHTLKRPMPTDNPALLYIQKGKDRSN